MAQGRKRKPDHLRLVDGSGKNHPERINKNAPKPSTELPHPPEYLGIEAAEFFRVVVGILDGMGIASADHTHMLCLAAMRFEEIRECQAVLEDLGRVYQVVTVTGSTMFKARPEVAMKNEAMRHLHGLLAEFGLSPSAVGKVSAPPGDRANEFAEFA